MIYLVFILSAISIVAQPGNGGGGGGPGSGQGKDPCNNPNPPASCVPVNQGIIWLMLAGGIFGFGIMVYQNRKNHTASSS